MIIIRTVGTNGWHQTQCQPLCQPKQEKNGWPVGTNESANRGPLLSLYFSTGYRAVGSKLLYIYTSYILILYKSPILPGLTLLGGILGMYIGGHGAKCQPIKIPEYFSKDFSKMKIEKIEIICLGEILT
jgi:hypothetical protein